MIEPVQKCGAMIIPDREITCNLSSVPNSKTKCMQLIVISLILSNWLFISRSWEFHQYQSRCWRATYSPLWGLKSKDVTYLRGVLLVGQLENTVFEGIWTYIEIIVLSVSSNENMNFSWTSLRFSPFLASPWFWKSSLPRLGSRDWIGAHPRQSSNSWRTANGAQEHRLSSFSI